MGIVGFALRYRHTFYVLALMMLFLGGTAIFSTPKDIFPNINIPVVTVIWQYTGLTPEEMEQRVTTYSEYSISSDVSDVRNIESQTLSGIAVEKIYFQPGVNIDLAIAQIVSGLEFHSRADAGGHSAAGHCAVQCVLSCRSSVQPELGPIERAAALRLRHLSDAPGAGADPRHYPADALWRQVPPDHGRSRPRRRCARAGITPTDVVNAVNAQSLTLPSGDAKIGDKQLS